MARVIALKYCEQSIKHLNNREGESNMSLEYLNFQETDFENTVESK
jgi:hypothetical protein